jgi:hypothetical protein
MAEGSVQGLDDLVPADIQVPRLWDQAEGAASRRQTARHTVSPPICLWSADAWQGAGGFALWLKVD